VNYFNNTDEIKSRIRDRSKPEKILAALKNKNLSLKSDVERINGIINKFKKIITMFTSANKILGKRLTKAEKGI